MRDVALDRDTKAKRCENCCHYITYRGPDIIGHCIVTHRVPTLENLHQGCDNFEMNGPFIEKSLTKVDALIYSVVFVVMLCMPLIMSYLSTK